MKRTIVLALLLAAGLALGLAVAPQGGKPAGVPPDVLKVVKNHCVRCHTGSKPPRGLSLNADRVGSLVGAPSAEAPTLLLVNPDDPEASYLLRKVRGAEGIGGKRMPLGGHLSPEELKVLEGWVAGLKK
jgi:mono/diheme cytochrome c family protein